MQAPCNCHVLAAEYKSALKAENIAIGSHGIDSPAIRERTQAAWHRYEQSRLNCPFRSIYPHY